MASFIALDVGEKRIGVAIADVSAPFPAPLTTLEATENVQKEFAELLRKNKAQTVVIGLPRNQKGEETAQTERVRYIVELLAIPKDIPVVWQDESLTSVKAEAELKNRKKGHTKADVDALAATYILEDFLQSMRSGTVQDPVGVSAQPKKPAHSKISKKKSKKNTFKRILIGVGVLLVFALLGFVSWYRYSVSPVSKTDSYSVVRVASGMGTREIGRVLYQQKLIRNETAFYLYVRLHGINNLQAGDYRLSSKQSVRSIVNTIASGKVTTLDILIAPGLRLDQIEAVLEQDGFSKENIQVALQNAQTHPLLQDLPANTKLEGYLFPETYRVGPETTATQLITIMLDTFQKKITPDIADGISKQGLTVNQAVILASIVQKEVSEPETQRTVAQVFLRRLREGKMLGSDVTFMYAAATTGKTATPDLDSPYNTRRYTGLPPSAISNFNISALKAVANPTQTDYLFFVAGDDGVTHFSRTLEEHQANTQKYCKKLCN